MVAKQNMGAKHNMGALWASTWACPLKVAYYSFIRVQEVYTINVQI